eukprot:TRINITY_DN7955_c0_g1_i2.p1 TRINITY_DN7955_c0_g1~~TRINITY_DN7955_c0_g1_i2.p1  ORF type:complete len:464 (+),score=126.03 TRINITY_DN7955_c0_g1_i2:90-1481(+)
MCIRDSSRIAWLVVAFVGVVHAAEEHKCAAKGCSGGPSTLKMQLREHWGKKSVEVPTANTGLVVVDMWAYHWCKTFAHRSGALVPRMEASLSLARSMGITIIFAPSTVTSAFEGHPRREASLALTKEWLWRPKFPFSGRPAAPAYSCMCGSSSSCQQNFGEAEQFQGLAVHDTDFIVGGINCDEEPCPDTAEILSVATAMNLSTLLYAGVASNVCVIDKPFGMERLARFGFRTVFLRDLAQPQMAWDQERGPDYTSAEVDSFIEKWVASSTSFEQSALASGWALPTELSHGGYITLAPFIALPTSPVLRQQPVRNESWYGSPLTLKQHTFERGVGMRGPMGLSVLLQPQWCAFGAVVGLGEADILRGGLGHDQAPWLRATVLLYLDGRLVSASPRLWVQGEVWPLYVELEPQHRVLKLVVRSAGGNMMRNPPVDVVGAGFFVKDPETGTCGLLRHTKYPVPQA